MSDESGTEEPPPTKSQFSLRTLFKLTTYSAVLIYIVWNAWDHLGITAVMFLVLSPFIFFAEIVDRLLGVKRR